MKKNLTCLICLFIFKATLSAQENKDTLCNANFDKYIAQGDEKALQQYIQECHQKPSEQLLQQYQIQTYTTLQATSLVCMGDYYAPRIVHLSYIAYTLAANQESLAAKVSLGIMLNEPKFKEKLPLNPQQHQQYKQLSQIDHPYNYYETQLELRTMSNPKNIKKYKKKHQHKIQKYADTCMSSLKKDIQSVKKEVKKFQHILQRKRNHDIELWADTEVHFALTKQQRLEKTLKSFKTLASVK